jgi:sulfur-carrier protein adenylyltransferase/sulfurtransferase
MEIIKPAEFEALRLSGEPYQLIDVREPFEAKIATLGGTLIPLATILDNVEIINKEGKVIVHCRSGKRSADAIQKLEGLGFKNLYNLEGGILAYSDQIDGTIPKY